MPLPAQSPSLDMFWNQDDVNEWTEQYSPRKVLDSPSKARFLDKLRKLAEEEDENLPTSPSSSPRKTPARSPKKSAAEKWNAGLRKTFEAAKHDIAAAFLQELDQVIAGGRVGELANNGTGIQIEWSKKLNSTAGRAHWKKEGRRQASPLDGQQTEIKYTHTALIELAEKVIDDEGTS
jgi:hypothetical protein